MREVDDIARVARVFTVAQLSQHTVVSTEAGERVVIGDEQHAFLIRMSDGVYQFGYGEVGGTVRSPTYFEPYDKGLNAFNRRASEILSE